MTTLRTSSRHRFVVALAAMIPAILLVGSPAFALAQDFPAKARPIRMLNPFPPGGTADLLSRTIAARLSKQLGVPVPVENRPGASTLIAVKELMNSAPDGHTMLYTVTGTTSQLPHLYSKPPFDPFTDVTPLGLAAYNRLILLANVHAPFSSVKELIDYAKANPGKVNYGSFGPGSFPHILSEMLVRAAGIPMLHVPFKGGADAGRALLSGEVQILFDAPLTAINAAKAGRVKMLAAASDRRLALIKDVPTMGEVGLPGFDIPGLEQLLGPPGMPPALVARVNAELVKAIRSPEVSEQYVTFGFDLVASNAEEHARIMRDNYNRWGEVIRRIGIKLD
jgi:tripartite-type tricarboxylate transporter receptor subunit TctC